MQKRKLQLFITSLFFLVFITGCKKYGYHFDNGYDNLNGQPGTVRDTTNFAVDKSMYAAARIFPGLVDSAEPRIQDTTVNFNFAFTNVSSASLGISYLPLPLFSTGLYEGPGELIRVNVPAGVNGLSVQIGSQTDNLATQAGAVRRDPVVYTVAALFPGSNYVRNLYGGYIWIKATSPISGTVALNFKNVVKTADYILGSTSGITAWKQKVMASYVPWLELRSNYAAFTVSRNLVVQGINAGVFDNIDQAMSEWDKIFTQDIYGWMGFSPLPSNQERMVMDIQPLNSFIHNGSIIVAQTDYYWITEWANLNTVKTANSTLTLAQILNNCLPVNNFWWSTLQAITISDLFAYKICDRNNVLPPTLGLNTGLVTDSINQAITYATVPTDSIGKIFDSDSTSPATGAIFRMTPFLQLFDKVSNPVTGQNGWQFFPFLYAKARSVVVSADDMSRRSFFYTTLCEFGQRDYAAFFKAWGIPLTTSAMSAMAKKYPPMENAIWEYNPLTKQGGNNLAPARKYHDRINWTLTASSVATNDGAANILTAVLDGDPNTYWETCWSGCNPKQVLPYSITVDMHQVNQVSGFYFVPRQGGRHMHSIQIKASNDNVNWQVLASLTLQNTNKRQEFSLPASASFRYFTIYFTDDGFDKASVGDMAELGTFYGN